MKKCVLCGITKTTIERANCPAPGCPEIEEALRGDLRKTLSKTDPDAPVDSEIGLTKRELFALEAMCCRLTNEDMYKRHGCQYEAVADDAVRWADALIDRLNGVQPKKQEDSDPGAVRN